MNAESGNQKESSRSTRDGTAANVRLRDVARDDLPTLYEDQLDPEANRMALTHPRSAVDFDAHWERVLENPNVVVKSILVGDMLAGCISCFQSDGLDSVGYWIGREFWGKGVATRALELFLIGVTIRPLHTRVAVSNVASLRVLQKCGFVVVGSKMSPATERFLECEETILKLE